MKRSRALVLLPGMALLAGLLLALTSGWAMAGSAVIETDLADKLFIEGTANFFVRMSAQADLSPAYAIQDWDARGQYVYDTLRQVAATSQAPVIEYAKKNGLSYRSFFTTNSVLVRGGSRVAAEDLAALPGVAEVRLERVLPLPEPIVEKEEAPQAVEWGIADTGADDVWSTYGVKGAGMKVSSIDTGVQWNHPALVNQFACPGAPSNSKCWYDPANICGGSACDNNGHGTHTMGTMVGYDGGANQIGMAPEAKWIACKGCESTSCTEGSLNSCADWIVAPGGSAANRPNVVNNSWGGVPGGDPWYLAKVNAWRAAGIFPSFSAGNSGSSCNSLGDPGDYQESFASAAHDSARTIASFSSRGASSFGHDPYTKPNISAPGVSVRSSVPTNLYSSYSGTSMASPHSAGAVALLWAACFDLRGSIDQTFRVLQTTADAPPAGNCGAPPDAEGNYTYGYGYLNVAAAIAPCFNRVVNNTFETGDTMPSYWTPNGAITASDIRDCTQAQTGSCSFRMLGNGQSKKLSQGRPLGGPAGGHTFSAWTKTKNVPATGNFRAIVIFYYTDGTQQGFGVDLPRGTHDWQSTSTTLSPTKAFTKTKVTLEYAGAGGRAYFDAISLR